MWWTHLTKHLTNPNQLISHNENNGSSLHRCKSVELKIILYKSCVQSFSSNRIWDLGWFWTSWQCWKFLKLCYSMLLLRAVFMGNLTTARLIFNDFGGTATIFKSKCLEYMNVVLSDFGRCMCELLFSHTLIYSYLLSYALRFLLS